LHKGEGAYFSTFLCAVPKICVLY